MNFRTDAGLVELITRALVIVDYLAVKYQNRDADEASRILAEALDRLEGK